MTFKFFSEVPRFGYGKRVIINSPDDPNHGLPVRIWDYSEETGLNAFFRVFILRQRPPIKFYRVEKIWSWDDQIEYPEHVNMMDKWKPHELRAPFDPVNYYKDQPGDTRDDI